MKQKLPIPVIFRLLLAIMLILPASGAFAQLTAAFTSGATKGCSPLVVSFKDQSTGNPTSWLWDFGNGNTSVEQNPSAAYLASGTYSVTLIVSDGTTNDTITKTNYVTVYFSPVAALNASTRSGCTPLSIHFTDQSRAGSAPIISWTWDFGDGTTSNLESPSHTYTNPGLYTIVLLVTDSNGCTNRLTLPNYININLTPTANFSANITSSCSLPSTVQFTNSSTGSGNNYQWNFGDGSTSTQASPTHTYTTQGIYSVQLIATSPLGCSDTLIKTGYINIGKFTTSFTVNHTVGCAGSTFFFTDQSSPSPVSWLWSLGHGWTSTDQNPFFNFGSPGSYTITLISKNAGGCSDTSSMTITVLPPPTVTFTADSIATCQTPFGTTFTAVPAGLNSYSWAFGDGTYGTGQTVNHVYNLPGSYTVQLTVGDSSGCGNTVTMNNYIIVQLPVAAFTATPLKGCAPLTVNFTDQSTSIDSIVSWNWNFGNGDSSNQQNPSETYDSIGLYTVSLIITTAQGCTDTLVRNQYIEVGLPPTPSMGVTDSFTCAHNIIQFFDTSGKTNSWLWYFGNGDSSNQQNPFYHYGDTGVYNIQLIAGYNGCYDTITKDSFMNIYGAIASFSQQVTSCVDPYTVAFSNTSINGQISEWSFGDGDTSMENNPTHTFPGRGSYSVTLYIQDTSDGCWDSITTIVTLTHPSSDFSASQSGCAPFTTFFTSNTIDAVTYAWSFGDDSTSTAPNVTHIYVNPGQYTVKLIVTDASGCNDTMTKVNYITVYGAIAAFVATPTAGCTPLSVAYTDSSSSFMGSIVSWEWNLGNGTTSTVEDPSTIYTVRGNYSVSLTVTDNNGCVDSVSKPNLIEPTFPDPAFTASQTAVCLGHSVKFNNHSTGTNLTYSWNFGDGATSTSTNPSHTYADTGYYTVSLTVADVNHCDSTLTKVNYIHVEEPIADFSIDTDYAYCPPLTVHFNDLSSGSVNGWIYNFGDGQTSTLQDPVHIYSRPGVYHPWLVVTNSIGCTDTFYLPDSIVIGGPIGTFNFTQPSVCIPFDVTFIAQTSSDISSMVWDYGDGNVDVDGDTVQHVYNRAGIYYPVLIIRDSVGCTQSIPAPQPVVATSVTADFTAAPPILCQDGDVAFTDLSSGIPGIEGWHWNFGDGDTSSLEDPVHYYATPGLYNVTFVAINDSGCTDTMVKPGLVLIYPGPHAAFTPSDTGVCQNVPINFTNNSTSDSTISTYLWNFGDGTTSSAVSPSHTYIPGTYTVSLVLTTVNGCTDTARENVTMYPLPALTISPARTICYGDTAHISVSGGVTYVWSPSTGLSNPNIANPVANPTVTTEYSILVTDIHGCQVTDNYTVNVNPLPVVTTSPDTTVCPGRPANISASGGISYVWSPSTGLSDSAIANPVATVTGNTTYTVTATDINGCKNTGNTKVLLYIPPTPIVSPDTAICIGASTQLQAGGGVSYQWSPATGLSSTNIANPVANPTATTDYSVMITDAHGCMANDSLIVTINPLPIAKAFPDTAICIGASANLNATGGVQYQWTPATGLSNSGIADPTATPSATSTYTVNVIDSNGCKAKDSLTVTINPLPVVTTSPDTTVCPGQSANISASGGVSYAWSPATGLSNANISNPLATVTSNTTYTITVTNANGCKNTGSTQVNLYTPPTPTISPDTAICIGASTQLQAGGGVSYQWSPSTGLSSTNIADPVADPTVTTGYLVVVTDTHGCKANDSVIVTINPLPTVQAFPDTAICIGASANLNATGGVQYQWSPVTGLSNSNIADPVATPTVTSTYTVHVIDSNGCKAKDSLTVTINPLPIPVISPDTSVCAGSSAKLIVSGGAQYSWSPIATLSCASCASTVATPDTVTTYSVQVTSAAGCVNFDSVQVNLLHINAAMQLSNSVSCMPDTIYFTDKSTADSAVAGWVWNFGDGDTSHAQNPSHIYTTAGHYTITLIATSAYGCTDETTAPLNIEPLPSIHGSGDATICRYDSTTLHAYGGTNYTWVPKTGLSDSNSAEPVASPDTTTTYTITGTNSSGCSNAFKLTVNVNPLPQPAITSVPGVCFGSSIALTATGGTGYSWSPAAGLSDTSIADPIASPAQTTDYTVLVTDSNGCQNTANIILNVFPKPVYALSNDTAVCMGGKVQLTATGSAHYKWSPSTGLSCDTCNNPVASPTVTTTYHITLTGADGCTVSDSITITVNPLPGITASPDTAICLGQQVSFFVSGGSTYQWLNSTGLNCDTCSNVIASPSTNQIYPVLITTSAGCSGMDTIRLKVHHLQASFTESDSISCSPATIAFTENSSSDTTITTIVWQFGDGQSSIDTAPQHFYSQAGNYVVTMVVNTAAGCDDTLQQPLTILQSPVASAGPGQTICFGQTAQLSASGTGSFQWNNGSTLSSSTINNPISDATITTQYVLTVTASNGCQASDSVTVTVNPLPVVTVSGDKPGCAGDTLHLAATGGGTYAWSPGLVLNDSTSAHPLFTADITRTFTVTVSNSYGCNTTDSITLKVNPLPTASINGEASICAGSSAAMNGVSNGTAQWSPPTGLSCTDCPNPVATPDTTTTYTMTVTNGNQCSVADTHTVYVNPVPTVQTIPSTIICNGETVTLTSTSTNATQYSWTPGSSLNDSTILSPEAKPQVTTKYTVTAQNIYGCSAWDTVTIFVSSKIPLNTSGSLNICAGSMATISATPTTLGNSTSYIVWSPASDFANPNNNEQTVSPDSSVTYTVIAYNGACAPDTETVHVTVNPLPTVSLGMNQEVFQGQQVMVQSSTTGSIVNYQWSPNDSLTCDTCSGFTFVAGSQSVNFNVTVTDANGCQATSRVDIGVLTSCEDDIFVPNMFSPNGDGVNDVLYVRGVHLTGIKVFRIFDRWGNLMFETTNMNEGWDGTYHGVMVNPAVFVYYVEGICSNGGDFMKKGNVTVVR